MAGIFPSQVSHRMDIVRLSNALESHTKHIDQNLLIYGDIK